MKAFINKDWLRAVWWTKKVNFQLGSESIIWINVPICMQRLFKPIPCVYLLLYRLEHADVSYFLRLLFYLGVRQTGNSTASQAASMMQYSNYYMCRRMPNKRRVKKSARERRLLLKYVSARTKKEKRAEGKNQQTRAPWRWRWCVEKILVPGIGLIFLYLSLRL